MVGDSCSKHVTQHWLQPPNTHVQEGKENLKAALLSVCVCVCVCVCLCVCEGVCVCMGMEVFVCL